MANLKETSVCILGFWFHIKWNNDNEGYDQRGTKWNNIKKPQCSNVEIVDICMDCYNQLTSVN